MGHCGTATGALNSVQATGEVEDTIRFDVDVLCSMIHNAAVELPAHRYDTVGRLTIARSMLIAAADTLGISDLTKNANSDPVSDAIRFHPNQKGN